MSSSTLLPEAAASSSKKQPKTGSKKDKLQKKDKSARKSDTAGAGAGGFSLVGSNKDEELDSVFGKSVCRAPTLVCSFGWLDGADRQSSFAAPAPRISKPPAPAAPAAEQVEASSSKKRPADTTESKKAKKAKAAAVVATGTGEGSESDVSAELPAASGSNTSAVTAKPKSAPAGVAASESDLDDDDGDISKLVHETVSAPSKKKAKPVKYTPPNETPTDKARRSLFIGNLPVECANSKKGDRQLIAHLLTFAPSAKVESVRFRSIAFKTPTSGVPGDEDKDKHKRRESERASAWKAEQAKLKAGGKEAEEADSAKSFLDAKGKRKVAFIKKEVRPLFQLGYRAGYVNHSRRTVKARAALTCSSTKKRPSAMHTSSLHTRTPIAPPTLHQS